MKRIKLTIAYDGTNYCGWQVQPNGITIEEVLNKALRKMTGEDITVMSAFNLLHLVTKSQPVALRACGLPSGCCSLCCSK